MNRFFGLLDGLKLDSIVLNGNASIKYCCGYLADYGYVCICKSGMYYLTDGRFTIEAKRDLSSDWQVVEITKLNALQTLNNILSSHNIKNIGIETDVSYNDYKLIEEELHRYDLVDITAKLENLRAVKSVEEIEYIKEAQKIAQKSLDDTISYIKEGVSEREICARLEFFMKINGADLTSFNTIVAFGENSAIAHAKPGDRKLKYGDIILFDFGVLKNGYCSDMTRSFVFGQIDSKIKEIYNVVLQAQCYAIENIRAGMTNIQADMLARKVINDCGYGDYFNHSLGHGVGIQIHEEPYLAPRGKEVVLKEGMVVTVEPGIYIEGLGGIRIEDMIVVGKDKSLNLTTSDKHLQIIN